MSALNPEIYYDDEANHGSYQYETLEMLVNNFMQNYTGNSTLLGPIQRQNVIFWMKKGIQQFTFDALKQAKAKELELDDALNITLPPDYVNYIRISWLNQRTGDLMPMSQNNKLPLATAYLQDNVGNILFDNDGNILEGDSITNEINDDKAKLKQRESFSNAYSSVYDNTYQHFRIDTSKNYNGTFIIDPDKRKIHFDSSFESKIIVLEYISDGLESSSEVDNIKVHKFAEYAIYNWVNYNLLNNKNAVPLYEKTRAKRDYEASYRNAKIRLLNIKIAEINQMIKGRNRWFR